MNNFQEIPTTNVPLEIRNEINSINKSYTDDMFLQRFQFIIKEYFIKSGNRGLLLYHTVGSGKSITAASIAESYRLLDPKRKIIVLLSKSLQENFKGNIRKYIRNEISSSHRANEQNKTKFADIENIIDTKYKFISLNASNMYSQFVNVNRSKEEIEFEKNIDEFNKHLNTVDKKFLENSILIIDEVHNLCNGIKNGSKNSIKLYNSIMNTKNLKLLFLTGTPIIDTPFILVPLFNMLKGYIKEGTAKENYNRSIKKHTLFPENMQEFYNLFVDKKERDLKTLEPINKPTEIKNRAIFQNRITGLVSYYGNHYFSNSLQEGFPEVKPIIVEKVQMSNPQLNRYMEMRSIEEKEEESAFKKPYAQGFEIKDSESTSSYKIRSRQVSNFFIPPYAVNEVYIEGRPKIEKNIYAIKDDDLKDLDKYSPKFKKIIENIQEYSDKLAVVYSEFVNGEGIILFGKVLEAREKYVYWHKINDTTNDINEFDIPLDTKSKHVKTGGVKKTYALIHGDVPFVERERIIKAFNSKQNINGSIISVLLISKSGAEGLSLRHVRNIHIMEPFWNYARIEQIIARGARFRSHESLPKEEQNIQPYIYISVIDSNNQKDSKDMKHKKTTDEELYRLSIESCNLKTQFEIAMIESSVDCSFNKEMLKIDAINCHLCLPDNKPLYSTEILNDLKLNSCKPFKEKSIELQKIKLPDDETTYYYVRNGFDITVYEYDKTIDKYIEMKKNNSKYSDITLQILQS
ncbi:MAG: DEAD/DEAH box helicase family protein [Cetobacterium sp.]